MKGITAREQRSAPTYFTLKSSIKSSSTTVSIGPVAVAEPPGADPLLTRMCRPPSCCAASATMRSTCSLLVTSAASGTMRRFVSAASSRAVALQIRLVPGHDRHIGPFASQFPRNGFTGCPDRHASYDRMLAVQSEVHGTLSRWRRRPAILLHYGSLFFLREASASIARRRTIVWDLPLMPPAGRRRSEPYGARPIVKPLSRGHRPKPPDSTRPGPAPRPAGKSPTTSAKLRRRRLRRLPGRPRRRIQIEAHCGV